MVNRADGLIAIEDINPKADVHLLVIPERHFADFREIGVLSADESKRMLEFIAETAQSAGLEEYRLHELLRRGRRADRVPPALARSGWDDARDAGMSLIATLQKS